MTQAKPKLDNRIRMITYQADELADALRQILSMLQKGQIDEAKQALRESIRKIGA